LPSTTAPTGSSIGIGNGVEASHCPLAGVVSTFCAASNFLVVSVSGLLVWAPAATVIAKSAASATVVRRSLLLWSRFVMSSSLMMACH